MNIKYAIFFIAPFYAAAFVFGMITAMLATWWQHQEGLLHAVGTGSMLALGVAVCLTLSMLVGLLSDFHRKIALVVTGAVVLVSPLTEWPHDYILAGLALVFVPLLLLDRLGLRLKTAR